MLRCSLKPPAAAPLNPPLPHLLIPRCRSALVIGAASWALSNVAYKLSPYGWRALAAKNK